MAFQRMILVPTEFFENRCHTSPQPPPFKNILETEDHSYKKWTQFRLLLDPNLKTERQKTGTHPHSHYGKW